MTHELLLIAFWLVSMTAAFVGGVWAQRLATRRRVKDLVETSRVLRIKAREQQGRW